MEDYDHTWGLTVLTIYYRERVNVRRINITRKGGFDPFKVSFYNDL